MSKIVIKEDTSFAIMGFVVFFSTGGYIILGYYGFPPTLIIASAFIELAIYIFLHCLLLKVVPNRYHE